MKPRSRSSNFLDHHIVAQARGCARWSPLRGRNPPPRRRSPTALHVLVMSSQGMAADRPASWRMPNRKEMEKLAWQSSVGKNAPAAPRPARRLRCRLHIGTPSYGTLAPTPASPTRLSGRSVSHRSRSTCCGSPAAGAVGFPTMPHVAEATLNYSEVREALVERYQSVPVDWIRYGKHGAARWSSID